MDGDIHRHPMPIADLTREPHRQLAPGFGRQLGSQRDFIFARHRRVLAHLDMMKFMRVILGGFALVLVVIHYQGLREPKVIERPYGCTSGWDSKKGACRGKWVQLRFNQP